MRTSLKALVLVGFGVTLAMHGGPSASAADLKIKRHHHRSVVVRDYDGAEVIRRVRRVVVRNYYDGTSVVTTRSDLYPVDRGAATRYLNGQPVLPHYPRGWPRVRGYGPRYS